MFDDFPVRAAAPAVARLPRPRRQRWRSRCFAAGGLDEGPRNAVAEVVLVVGCFAALGRRLGLALTEFCCF